MKVLIIEDEKPAAKKIAKFLDDYDNKFEVVSFLDSVDSSIEWFKNNPQPDLIFADIHLSDGLSFEIFRNIPLKSPVIFTTAYDQYAINAFEVNSVDYLLKPIKFESFSNSIEKFEKMKNIFNNDSLPKNQWDINSIITAIEKGKDNYKSRFLVKNGQKIRAVKANEIAYFYSEDKLTFLMTHDKNKYPVDFSLDEVMGMLDPNLFFKVNRKFIIHIDAAHEIHPYFKGRLKLELVPFIDKEIIVSSEKTPQFKNWLSQ